MKNLYEKSLQKLNKGGVELDEKDTSGLVDSVAKTLKISLFEAQELLKEGLVRIERKPKVGGGFTRVLKKTLGKVTVKEWNEKNFLLDCVALRNIEGIDVVEVEEEIYDEMLEVLPPINFWQTSKGKNSTIYKIAEDKIKNTDLEGWKIKEIFSVGEASHDVGGVEVYATFANIGKKFYHMGYFPELWYF